MAIRLCHACSCEVNDGDKVCRHCQAILDKQSSIIEVVGDDEGFNFGSNRNAYEDEALKNFKHEHSDVQFEEIGSQSSFQEPEAQEEFNDDNIDYDFDENRNIEKMYNRIVGLIRNPKDYMGFLVGLIGVVLVIVGIILPLFVDSNGVNHFAYKSDMYYCGIIIAMINVIAAFLIIRALHKFVLIPSVVTVTMLVYIIFYFMRIDQFQKIGYGYIIMWFGVITIIISIAFVGRKDKKHREIIRGDYRNKPFVKHDFIWLLIVIFATIVAINMLVQSQIGYFKRDNASDKVANQTTVTINFENTSGNIKLTVLDTYIINNEDKLAAIVEVLLENNTDKATSFNEMFTITAYQDGRQLTLSSDVISRFDLSTPSASVGSGLKQQIYFAFPVDKRDDVNVTLYRNNNNEMVYTQDQKLNSMYLLDDSAIKGNNVVPDIRQSAIPSQAPNGNDSKDDNGNKNNNDDKSGLQHSEKPVSTSIKATSKSSVKPATSKPIEVTPTAEVTKKPTIEPTKEASWSIYVNITDDSEWGDDIHIYIYSYIDGYADNRGVEWPGVKMVSLGNGKYKFTYGAEWNRIGKFLINDGDGGHQYPKQDVEGIAMNSSNYSYDF